MCHIAEARRAAVLLLPPAGTPRPMAGSCCKEAPGNSDISLVIWIFKWHDGWHHGRSHLIYRKLFFNNMFSSTLGWWNISLTPTCMMDWRTLDKVSIPYESAHRFLLYSDRPHQVLDFFQQFHHVTRSLEISQRSSGAPVILQKSSALVFSSLVTLADIDLWLVEGWVHAGSSFKLLHDNRFCHFRNQSSNSFWVPPESFCWESSKTYVASFFSAWRISQSVVIIHPSKHQSITLIEEILHQLTWRISLLS